MRGNLRWSHLPPLTPCDSVVGVVYYNDGSTIASSRSPCHRDPLTTWTYDAIQAQEKTRKDPRSCA
jgi:hypothetical protein